MHKDLRKLVKAAEAQGFGTFTNRKGHLVFTVDGQIVAIFSGTPSDHRSWTNSMARLRRAGFDGTLDHKGRPKG